MLASVSAASNTVCQAERTSAVGTITRTYISSTGVSFTPGDVCVFEGLQHTLTVCREWYTARQTEGQEGEKARETERKRGRDGRAFEELQDDEEQGPAEGERPSRERATFSFSNQSTAAGEELSLPASVVIHSSEPIVERRSAFQGHAVQLDDPRHVPLVIHQLLSDRKIAKATHPAIFAYRISQDKAGKQVLISGKLRALYNCAGTEQFQITTTMASQRLVPGSRTFFRYSN